MDYLIMNGGAASDYGTMIAKEAVITYGDSAHHYADFYCHSSHFNDVNDVGIARCAFYGEVERLTE
jgi:hypothetical protein